MSEAVVVACETIEDEVRLALSSLLSVRRPPVIWVQSGLHDWPEKLHSVLAEIIGRLDEGASASQPVAVPSVRPGRGPAEARREIIWVAPVDTVVLAFGFCGRALIGLRSQKLRLIFPRVDDCISLLLSNGCGREQIPRNPRHYYLTRGWFSHETTLILAFEKWAEQYGPERATTLRRALFAGYEQISVLDTGAYDLDECLEPAQRLAKELGLKCAVVQGSVELLRRLFRVGYSEDNAAIGGRKEIVVALPGEEITFEHLVRVS